jgi:hypothetical protein
VWVKNFSYSLRFTERVVNCGSMLYCGGIEPDMLCWSGDWRYWGSGELSRVAKVSASDVAEKEDAMSGEEGSGEEIGNVLFSWYRSEGGER